MITGNRAHSGDFILVYSKTTDFLTYFRTEGSKYAHISLSRLFLVVKGIFSDSNSIFLWHESEDIKKKKKASLQKL